MILISYHTQLTPLIARRSLKTRGSKISNPKTIPEIKFFISRPDFHSSAMNIDFAPIRRAVSPAHSPQTKLYFFNLKKTLLQSAKSRRGCFTGTQAQPPPKHPPTATPRSPAAGSLQNTPKAFYSGRKGGACLGSLQSIIKRQIIDNYPWKYIREAEAVARRPSHPSLAPCNSPGYLLKLRANSQMGYGLPAAGYIRSYPTFKITF